MKLVYIPVNNNGVVMPHFTGCSSLLSDEAISLSQKILSRFTLTPYQRKFEELPTFISGLAGPCPCDECPMNTACADTCHQCQGFRQFVQSGRWLDGDIAVDLK